MNILRIVRKSLAFICGILLFLTILSVMLLTATKNIISKESIADYINKSDVLEIKVGKLFKVENANISEDSTVRETVIIMANDAGIPKDVVNDLVESNELNNLLGDFIRGIIDYAIIGGEKPTISSETIKNLVNVANNSLESHIDIVMEEEDLDLYIESYIKSLNSIVPERNDIVTDISNLDMIRNILTFNTSYLYVTIGILTILISLLLWNWYYPIKYLGITTTLAGVIFTVIGSLEWPIYNLIKDRIEKMEDLVRPLLEKVLAICFKEGVIYTVIGIVLIITFIVLNRFFNNKRKLEETRRINIEEINI